MSPVYGMRVRGDVDLLTAAEQLTDQDDPPDPNLERQLLFAARIYRCPNCKAIYESLPGLRGAAECRSCGFRGVEESP